MKFKSEKGYSLLEIGIALIIVGIFFVSSMTLLNASNENYRRIEQRNIALSFAMRNIEAMQLEEVGISLEELVEQAKEENNMEIFVDIENLPPKNRSKLWRKSSNYYSKCIISSKK